MIYRGYTIQKAEYPDKYNPSRVGLDILHGKETIEKNVVNTETAKWVIDKLIERGKIPNYEDQD